MVAPDFSAVTRFRLEQDPAGAAKTLDVIRYLIVTGSLNRSVLDLARKFANRNPSDDPSLPPRRIFEWVRDNVTYTPDPRDAELIMGAPLLLERRAGDCDDLTVLEGALLRALSYGVLVTAIGKEQGIFTHVFPSALYWDGNRKVFIPMDCAPGEAGPEYTQRMAITISP